MLETALEWVAALEPWWPFVVKVLVLWFVSQVMKKQFLTKGTAEKSGFVAFLRKTMSLHPMIAGALWGAAYPWMPATAIVATRGGAVTEGILAGVMTVVGYRVLEFTAEWFVKRNPDSKWAIVLRVMREAVPNRQTVTPKKNSAAGDS